MPNPVLDVLFANGDTVTLTQAQLEALVGAQAPAAPETPAAATVPPAAQEPPAPPATPPVPAAPAIDPARELAFLKAGVDVTTPVGSLLLRTYDGELTPEAVTAAATPLGLVRTGSPVTPAEGDQTGVRTGLQHNATVPPGQEPDVHPIVAGFKDGLSVLDRGGSYIEAAAAHIARVNRAGMDGDSRVRSRGTAGPGDAVPPIDERKGFLTIREVAGLAPRVGVAG